LVRPTGVEVGDVFAEHAVQVPFAQNDDTVEALGGRFPGSARRSRSCPGAKGGLNDPDAHALRGLVEVETELAVAIADEYLGSGAERRGVSQLLGRPLLGWGMCNGDVHDGSCIDVNYK
jgi:hypothetical protein